MTRALAFNSRTSRENYYAGGRAPSSNNANLGPGHYSQPDGMAAPAPSCAPFNSTSARGRLVDDEGVARPGPGSYSLSGTLDQGRRYGKGGSNAFKSKARRLAMEKSTAAPGPGAYDLRSNELGFRGKGPSFAPTTAVPEFAAAAGAGGGAMDGNINWSRMPTVPSIPTKAQSYGYEEGEAGELMMQQPVDRRHTGRTGDTVGPGDYTPHMDAVKSKHAAVDFARGSMRPTERAQKPRAPGPGYYRVELAESGMFSDRYNLRMRPSAMFRSKVAQRESPTGKNKGPAPGPGTYNISPTIKVKPNMVDESLQCFGSTSARIAEPRNGAAAPGPGAYLLPKSTFDASRKQAWARPGVPAVGFSSTSGRFDAAGQVKPDTENAPVGYATRGFADDILRKPQNRTNGFGSSLKRFVDPMAPASRDDPPMVGGARRYGAGSAASVLSRAGSEGVAGLSGVGAAGTTKSRRRRKPKGGVARMQGRLVAGRDVQTKSSFFASSTGRFHKDRKGDEGAVPPPGAYDPNFDALREKRGVVSMDSGPKDRFAEKSTEESVGPGNYNLPTTFGDPRKKRAQNRRNVLISTSQRFQEGGGYRKEAMPGPGSYDPGLLYGSLIKPTSNILIAEQSTNLVFR
uniref:Sperm-tail PG-rich repeat-containing protein 2 n=1 Tax=Phaeomonas parva TaxID=124430 RepID=A0A7S1U572_9STRA|mmetsp:Transcript_31996/g.101832  ORF Transcript_31996/g.101832 Transcript_31996/m.101832 type:complete len:628 (+) Transcript_31996:297-2180(+)|eukprot:CAMPEP_0118861604 /NCGR_PEP_ID=MMETSP1163-20130328/7082_1 /TAXON_ID=124430 /ORGANISM="Phaeomonas parva, Strain CCMP2877" /LENGTH=627 /DNA_ID=CAMNT_0006795435 /DNA_START=266 /DNA_END=2149 /DNA_ORIENTATION=-